MLSLLFCSRFDISYKTEHTETLPKILLLFLIGRKPIDLQVSFSNTWTIQANILKERLKNKKLKLKISLQQIPSMQNVIPNLYIKQRHINNLNIIYQQTVSGNFNTRYPTRLCL